ncbi:unnamed protein product, partial [Ectocarpus sp. 12 AP-2014]
RICRRLVLCRARPLARWRRGLPRSTSCRRGPSRRRSEGQQSACRGPRHHRYTNRRPPGPRPPNEILPKTTTWQDIRWGKVARARDEGSEKKRVAVFFDDDSSDASL